MRSRHLTAIHLGAMALGWSALAATGCSGSVRFAERPVVWAVDDKRTIPEPEEREFLKIQYFGDLFFLRRSQRALELRDLEPAWNVNALEEVPDSSWFENRIGLRDLTPEQVAKGPAVLPPPRPPYKVIRGKTGGGNAGVVVEDAQKRTFLLKWDRPENPEMQTGNSVVGNRIVWAFGYHVPRDYLIDLRVDEIVIPEDATAKDAMGDKLPYTREHLDDALKSGPPPRGGVYRTSASEYLDGKPIGGWANEGVRDDDINDVVPHEHRRENRGLRVLAAWINHSDMKEDNTLDTYVEEGGRKFIKHHLIDFGEVFGGHAAEKNRAEDGWEHYFDWQNQPKAWIALGLWKRPWEGIAPSPYKAVGLFSAVGFQPLLWREAYPFWPFWEMDRVDAFWGAKIVMRFSKEHIRAAVAEGRFSEPGAADYLVKQLVDRRDAIGRVWLDALSPLDGFEVRPGYVCATDLAVHHGLATVGAIERLDDDEDAVASARVDRTGKACVAAPTDGDYQVVTLRVRRGTVVRPPLEVHLARGKLVGLVRDPKEE
jgi:hypothetical protein